jgi:hypothetical protein
MPFLCSAIRQEQIGEFGRIDLKTIRNKQAWLLNNCRNAKAANPSLGKVREQQPFGLQVCFMIGYPACYLVNSALYFKTIPGTGMHVVCQFSCGATAFWQL